MGCFSGGTKGQSVQQVPKLTPDQEKLVAAMSQKALPAIEAMPQTSSLAPSALAPLGLSALQQQAVGMGSQLPNYLQSPAFGAFDPSQINMAMQPVGQYARQMFQQETVPSIMGALGYQGAARSSGAADILGREGRNLSMGLASQFAPMQYQGLQDQLNRQAMLPGLASGVSSQMAGLGQLQASAPEAQRQWELSRWMSQTPEASPLLQFIGPALQTSAYDTAVQQGYYTPGLGSQLLGFGGSILGGMAQGGTGFFK